MFLTNTMAPSLIDSPYRSGRHSVKTLVKELNSEGVTLRGRKLYSSDVHDILRKRLYSGDFDWDGLVQ